MEYFEQHGKPCPKHAETRRCKDCEAGITAKHLLAVRCDACLPAWKNEPAADAGQKVRNHAAAGRQPRQTGAGPGSRFDELEPGRSRTELTHLLPGGAFPYPPDHARSAHRPPGAACEFYRSGRDLFDLFDLYRLCWTDGRLVAKDTWEATDTGRTSG
ncbi:hypothetical protein [Streptomyces tanashiensis]|uniref:hypothetical protein n=1 Tax=Streptomyces tanashiensis TaxID=67367 RepID=UPI0033DB0094